MTKAFTLYIANTKMQNEQFNYRVPLASGALSSLRIQEIPSGSQIAISGELSKEQLEAIISQHRTYGLVAADEAYRFRGFAGLIYSVDVPVEVDRIASLMKNNHEVLDERGRKMREEAAVATAVGLEQQLQGDGAPKLKEMTAEVEEVRTKTSDTPETPAQRVKVSRDAPAPKDKG